LDAQHATGDELIAAHRAANRNLRIVSLTFPILFMGLILWNLRAIAQQVQDIDGPAVGTEISNRMNALMPDINDQLGELADSVHPALFTALQTEAAELAPQIEGRLQADVQHTLANAQQELQHSVARGLEADQDEQRAQLIAAFPELANDTAGQDAVLAASRAAVEQWSASQLDAMVTEHLSAMEGLRKTLETSYTKKEGESADPEDALMALLNLMNENVGGSDEILADGKTRSKAGKAAGAAAPAGKE